MLAPLTLGSLIFCLTMLFAAWLTDVAQAWTVRAGSMAGDATNRREPTKPGGRIAEGRPMSVVIGHRAR